MKPSLLFLCHRIPFPPNKGDKIRSYHLLRHLSGHFDIYLATFVDDPDDWQWVSEVEKYCTDSFFKELKPLAGRLRSLSGFLQGRPLCMPYYHNAEMQTWINARVEEHSISHALVYSAAMSQYALSPKLPFERRVIDFVDIDSDKWAQYAALKSWPMNWVYRREGKLLLSEEREVAAKFDASLFVSSAEAQLFKDLAPESADKIGFYNNGVDTVYFSPEAELLNPYGKADRVLVFTGAMDYWPNVDAVVWVAKSIFPQIVKNNPAAKFYIVGSNPTDTVVQLSKQPGVVVTGRVEDVRPYLKYAAAAVAPMRIARGIQNKVLEAMAMEKPVIVTDQALEGIGAVDGEQVLLANTAVAIEKLVQQLFSGEYSDVGAQARQKVVNDFSWAENLPLVSELLGNGTMISCQEGAHG
ncbi:MAG: sugar transferase (PEP-CTERM/EpsH1 system associated) [Halioglobus sp.]